MNDNPTNPAGPTLAERAVVAVLVVSWLAVLLIGFGILVLWVDGLPINQAEIVLFDIVSIAIITLLLDLGMDVIVAAVQRVFRSTGECQQ